MSRDVPMVRLVYSDAAPYDAGYVGAEELAGRVRVRRRGGTLLQSAIDLLERARDFPEEGPILVITDTRFSEPLRIRREHAFLIPDGFWLPFRPVGPVFRMR
jgi:hypothetical protein